MWRVEARGSPWYAAVLRQSLVEQWSPPPSGPRPSTHRFFKYPAVFAPSAARIVIDTMAVPGDRISDPFCGSGTVLVEAARKGCCAYGSDLSPLAECVARGHTWMPSPSTSRAFQEAAARVVAAAAEKGVQGALLTHAREGISTIEEEEEEEVVEALWFVYAAALQRAAKRPKSRKTKDCAIVSPELYHSACRDYIRRVLALVADVPAGTPRPEVERRDARTVPPQRDIDLILTSPPYAGVYDYLMEARTERVRMGESGDVLSVEFMQGRVPSGRSWPAAWTSEREIGPRKAYRRSRGASALHDYTGQYCRDLEACLVASHACLKQGAFLAIMLGNGEQQQQSALSTLFHATRRCVESGRGWNWVADATISSAIPPSRRPPGTRRTEHMVVLQRAREAASVVPFPDPS